MRERREVQLLPFEAFQAVKDADSQRVQAAVQGLGTVGL